MMRYGSFLFLVVSVLYSSKVAYAFCEDESGNCTDCESWCPGAAAECNNLLFARTCAVTCDACPSAECRKLGCQQRCIPPANENETAKCDCLPGYELNDDTLSCDDIDECDVDEDICDDGDNTTSPVCINTVGDYVCSYCDDYESDNVFSYYGARRGCCRTDTTTCGKSSTNIGPNPTTDDSEVRIQGGESAFIQRWPWHAYIRLRNGSFLCGGSLIDESWIVTAAHCLIVVGPSDSINVLLGAADLLDFNNERAQIIEVDFFIIHENYDGFVQNDIGLIRLQEPVKITPFVNIICLPGGEVPSVGENCYVAGFGLNASDIRATVLQQAYQRILSDDFCNLVLSLFLTPSPFDAATQICAESPIVNGTIDTNGQTPCQGDSGGALTCQRCDTCDWYLAGIVSFSLSGSCGLTGIPSVYSEITVFEQWIRDRIYPQPAFTPETCSRPTWDEWGQWSECVATCGPANQVRTRACLDGVRGQPDCLGDSRLLRSCNLTECEGSWSNWADRAGAECSEPCGGGGEVEQVRFCIDGTLCEGPSVRLVTCNEEACTGAWSDWSSWSDCSVTCDGGNQTRTRVCLEIPANCPGSSTDTGVCNTGSCGCGSLTNGISDSLCCTYLANGAAKLCTLAYYYRDNCAATCCKLIAGDGSVCS